MNKDILYPLRCLHGCMHERKLQKIIKKEYRERFLSMRKKNPKTVFLILTPDHGNMGDHAIAYAETKILMEFGIDYIEVSITTLYEWQRKRMLDLMNGFPILISGGGNMGTLWFSIEKLHRNIVKCNPKSSIMILPNTIYYEPSDWGNREFEKSKKIFNRHKRLVMYSRERISYEVMFPAYNNVKIIPDMALSLPHMGKTKERKGCLLCLRSDKEQTRTEKQEKMLRKHVANIFGSSVYDTDMLVASVPIEERENALQAKIDEICGAELVITDRLHGMLFCAITGTPCIVIDSKSPKVKGCYEWICQLEYIRLAEDVSDIAKEYEKIPKKYYQYDNSLLKHYFVELAQDILSIL